MAAGDSELRGLEQQQYFCSLLVLHYMVHHIKQQLQLRTQNILMRLLHTRPTGRPVQRRQTFAPRPKVQTVQHLNAVKHQDTDAHLFPVLQKKNFDT